MALTVFYVLFFLRTASCEGQSWQRIGPPGGNVISLAADDQGTIYLGAPDGHLFASEDRAEHWQLRGRVGGRLDGVVQSIVADPRSVGHLLAAVWFQDPAEGGGVFESLDGARHWKLAGLSGEAVRALEHSKSDPNIWLAGTRTGVFRSVDNAHSWQRITPSHDIELQNVDSLAVDPSNPEIIYVGTYHLPWKTVDGGKTWSSIASGMIDDSDIMSLRIDAKNPSRIFSSACSGIYRSEDAGASWIKLQGIPYASRRTQQIAQDPANPRTLYAATTEGLWKTSDSGENWQRVTPRDTVANAVVVLPGAKADSVLVGTEAQGILRSVDGGTFILTPNDGFSHRVMESFTVDPRDSSHFLALVTGSAAGLLETRDTGAAWREFPADSPPHSAANLYASRFGWWLSLAGGGIAQFNATQGKWQIAKFREIAPRIIPDQKSDRALGSGHTPLRTRLVSPHVNRLIECSASVIVATDEGLWKRGPTESEFSLIPAKNISRPITYLSAGWQDSLLAIAGNQLWKADLQAAVWNPIALPPDSGRLLWVNDVLHAEDHFRLLGTQNGVFFSLPGGPWRLLARGLPAIASEPLAVSNSIWMLAMSNGGIYQSRDFGANWKRMDADSERGMVTAILPLANDGFVLASQSEGVLLIPASTEGRP